MFSRPIAPSFRVKSLRLTKRQASIHTLLLAACLLIVSSGAAGATNVQAGSDKMITTASAVRVRSGPQVTAREVTRLKLGTVVSVLERSSGQDTIGQKQDYWYRVSLPDGKTGWVFGGLMTGFDPAHSAETYLRIASERLKLERAGFEDHVDLVNFLSRVVSSVREPETKAELELDRLLALKLSLEAIPFDKQEQPPYRAWTKARDAEVVYSEPAGQWLVRAQLLWDLQKKYRSLPIAERIAWEAARTFLPGECEGYIPCYVYLSRITDGEYLKLYPEGAHARASLKSLSEYLAPIVADLKEKKTYEGPTDKSELAEMKKGLEELRAIVTKTSAPETEEVLKQINQVAQSYP